MVFTVLIILFFPLQCMGHRV